MAEREHWFVITHEVSNTGASRMLLQILQGARALRGEDWSCEILSRGGGALEAEFAQLGRVHVLPRRWAEGRSLRAGVLRKFLDRPWLQPRRLKRWMPQWEKGRFDVVYNNTATNGPLVSAARRLHCPIVTHVHELGEAMRRFNSPEGLAQTIEHSDRFIAVSPPVASDLAACGASAEKIRVVPNFLPTLPPLPTEADRRRMRAELGLPADAQVIVGCGHIDRIKGVDLFVEMAAVLAAQVTRRERLRLVWLGGVTDRRYTRALRRQVRQRGLDAILRFAGPVEQASSWFAASDIVAVTSRLESFSLVALEAAALGRPVIGFRGARGLGSVLGEDSPLLVAGHDAAAMAAVAAQLLADPTRRDAAGQDLRGRIGEDFLAPRGMAAVLSITDEVRRARGRMAR